MIRLIGAYMTLLAHPVPAVRAPLVITRVSPQSDGTYKVERIVR